MDRETKTALRVVVLVVVIILALAGAEPRFLAWAWETLHLPPQFVP